MTVFDELSWRGMLYDSTEGVAQHLAAGSVTLYNGFDPTAASLHVGSLVPIMGLVHFQRHGHSPIALVGGGTGMIGDPSGKAQERQLLTRELVQHNVAGIREQLSRFLDFDAPKNPARLIDNGEWLTQLPLIDFLRDVGKYFTVNYMLAKDSVRSRIEREDGISYTEFSYMLLQAYDYMVLHDRFGCTLQCGGSDQWGNIVAGTELVRKLRGTRAFGLVFPLITTASGVKFGKTEAGTIWLDAKLTSPFRFYQFWLNTGDKDVLAYLKLFTLLGREAIVELEQALANAPERREPQRRLAQEVTRLVHGEGALHSAEQASRVLFGEAFDNVAADDLADIFADVPSSAVGRGQLDQGAAIVDLLVVSGLAPSKSQARRLVEGGGIYLNNQRVAAVDRAVSLADTIEGRLLVLRKGAREYHLLRVEG
jgi:tyrosyl-tRNA synthetase